MRLAHHSKDCADVCGQAGSKKNSPGRGEVLQRPARSVHRQPYMYDLRRLVTVAELLYITNPNNVCCISVITLILICFRIKLDASAVTLTWMRCCACMSPKVQEFLCHMWRVYIFGHELILLSVTSTNFCCSNITNIPSSGIGLDFSPVLLSYEILISQNFPLTCHIFYRFIKWNVSLNYVVVIWSNRK